MEVLGFVLRLLLAAVFVLSGVTKLADRPRTVQAVRDLGVPARYSKAVATVLPPLEVLTAVLLVLPATALVGLALAAGLLVVFSAVVVRLLRRGRRPDCGCFGSLVNTKVSTSLLVRNGVLLVVAAVAAVSVLAA